MSIEELRAQMSKEAKRDALKCLRSSSQQLGKASYQIDKLIEEFQRTRIPVRRQAIVNQAIDHLVTTFPAIAEHLRAGFHSSSIGCLG